MPVCPPFSNSNLAKILQSVSKATLKSEAFLELLIPSKRSLRRGAYCQATLGVVVTDP